MSSSASTSFSTSVVPFTLNPDTIRSRSGSGSSSGRQIPSAVSLPRDPESPPLDRFPDPLQKFYIAVLERFYLDIVRQGQPALFGLSTRHLSEWRGICLDIEIPGDTVPELIAKALEVRARRQAGEKIDEFGREIQKGRKRNG